MHTPGLPARGVIAFSSGAPAGPPILTRTTPQIARERATMMLRASTTKRGQRAGIPRFGVAVHKGQGTEPVRLVTDKLRSYGAAHRTIMPSVRHDTKRYANNRAEVSHQPTRQRERQMRRFKSPGQAQRFLSVHGIVQNLFRVEPWHKRAPAAPS